MRAWNSRSKKPNETLTFPAMKSNERIRDTEPNKVSQLGSVEDDSVEDEFRKGMQAVNNMQLKYEALLLRAIVYQKKASDLADASKQLASQLDDTFSGVRAVIGGPDVLSKAVKVEHDFSQLLDIYSEHVGQSLVSSTGKLLEELKKIQETCRDYDSARVSFESSLTAHGGDEDAVPEAVKDAFEESANTLGARLTTWDRARPKHCFSHLINHQEAQKRYLRRALQQVTSLDPLLQQVMSERQLACSLPILEAELQMDIEEEFDEAQREDTQSAALNPNRASQPAAPSKASSAARGSSAPSMMKELSSLPSELPVEWSSLLSGVDAALGKMGAQAMDVSDAVFAINALVEAGHRSALAVPADRAGTGPAGSSQPALASIRGMHGSFSAPLSQERALRDLGLDSQPLHATAPAPALSSAAGAGSSNRQSATFKLPELPLPHGAAPLPRLPALSVSGPIPRPSASAKAQSEIFLRRSHFMPEKEREALSLKRSTLQIPLTHSQQSVPAPLPPTPPLYSAAPALAPAPSRKPYFSGPLDSPTQFLSQSFKGRPEPLYKSGPIPRSSFPPVPSVTELHKLPPPPLPPTAILQASALPLLARPQGEGQDKRPLRGAASGASSSSSSSSSSFTGAWEVGGSLGRASRRPTVATIYSEGSEDGESSDAQPSFHGSPRLVRSQSMSSTDSGVSQPGAARPQLEFSSLSSIRQRERDALLEEVGRAKVRWRSLIAPRGMPTVPDMSAVAGTPKEAFLRAMAAAVLSKRKSSGPSAGQAAPVNR